MEKLNLFNKILQTEVPLAMYTWLQLGGPAEYFAEPRSESELSDLLKTCFEEKVPVRVFGLGTNLLVSDLGVPGLVIRLSDPVFSQVEVNGPLLDVGAGTRLGRLITLAVHEGLAGLESFIGIPGTVGGAVMENISTSDGAIGEWVESLKIMTVAGEIHELSREEVVFGYRSCSLENAILLSVRFRLVSDQEKELARRLQKIWIVRKKTQPMGYQGVGRLFKNPRGQNASDLIEAVGLKGTRIGGAAVSDRDANFVLVEPECSCDDVKRLIRLIQTQVREQEDVDLEVELTIW